MSKSNLFGFRPASHNVFCCLLLGLLLSLKVTASGQYSFEWNGKPLSTVFADIEKKAKVTFAYNSADIDARTSISLRVENATLDNLIAAVCNKINARYKISGNIVMIQDRVIDANGQPAEFTITGKVVDQDNEEIQGATVTNKTTNRSTRSKENGSFIIRANDGDIISISNIGYETKSVSAKSNDKIMIVEMQRKALELNPVVVTALGIKRETRSLGYAVGEVDGSELNKAREVNVINSLAGKVPGLIINSTAGGPAGSSRVIIRGNTELTGNNQPLYVVDGVPIDNSNYGQAGSGKYADGYDFGDAISAINPDDIETISVLKGPSASALYGSRAGHGVILITTKKGGPKKTLGVELNSTATMEKILTHFDDYQYEYGQGLDGSIPRDALQARTSMFSNFGAKLDPNLMIPGFDGVSRPYGLVKDNIENFFRTGTTFTNTISLTGATDNTTFRLSVSDLRNNDIIPKSNLTRNTINLRGTSKFGKHLSVDAKAVYIKETVNNRPGLADDPSNIGNNFIGLANNIDQKIFEQGYKTPGGDYVDWGGGQYRLNPYWVIDEMRNSTKKDRIIGNLQANYTFTDWMSLQGRISSDITFLDYMKYSPRTTPGSLLGRIEGLKRKFSATEADLLLSFQKQLTPDFYGGLKLGASLSHLNQPGTAFQGTDMQTTDAISFNSFKDKTILDIPYEQRMNSFYGLLTLGFKNYLYMDATLRRDATSTLSAANNTYYYPSLSGSFIFSDAFHIGKEFLTFGKVRVSAAEVGSGTEPYRLNVYYSLNEKPFMGQSVGGISTPINPEPLKPDPDLVPTRTRSFEAGTELRFLKNRLHVDFTYYTQRSRDQINVVPLANSSGFTTRVVNGGLITNSGIELLIGGSPIQGKDFNWDVTINYAKNKNTVKSLAPDVAFIALSEARWLGVSVVAMPNAPYGAILGYDYQYDGSGNIILDPATLLPIPSDDRKVLGKGTWDWTGGINNSFSYKNFTFGAVIDVKVGADLFSMTNLYAALRGSDVKTLEGRQEWIASEEQRIAAGKTLDEWKTLGNVRGYVPKGVVQTGTDSQGKPIYETNTRAIDPGAYWPQLNSDDHGIVTPYLYDASYVKLRELTLSYNLPAKLLGRLHVSNASISIVSRNPFIIHKNVPNVDPDSNYNNGNGQGFEYGSLPSRKSWGVNLNVRF